ncbi:MAG: HAMP domain-containing histidine kinase, partial [Bacteroidaceae bacterium]|nr:HAMP domain-containing histidine kinase [Bacteroidaceae bacterium]
MLFLSLRTRKRIERERDELLKEKASDNTAVHNLANELKTPLSMIYNPVKNIIESSRTDIITRTRLESVLQQTDIMTRMVNIIMEETDEGIEKKGVNTESVELNNWIDYLADEFMVNNESRNIVIKSEPDPSIDSVILDKEITSEAFYAVLECIVSYCNDDCTLT